MLATPTRTPGVPPTGDEWLHEVKWDGVRAVGHVTGGQFRLFNRTEGDITDGYPEVVEGTDTLPDLIVDGELVVLDSDGIPSFHEIAHRMHARNPAHVARHMKERPAIFVVFDLLALDGRDLTRLPLAERRALLEGIGLTPRVWQLSESYDDGAALAEFTRNAGLEGVVSKKRTSQYLPGARSTDWVKTAHRAEVVTVIGGWLPETDAPDRLGAVWVGNVANAETFEDNPVLYSLGRVGSGLSQKQRAALLTVLRDIERDTPAFDRLPADPEIKRTRWVEPLLCVQVRYLNVTPSGSLRQPVLMSLRPDVSPLDADTAELN